MLVLVACASCGGRPAAATGPPAADPAAAVFGDESWRTPASIDFIGFHGERLVVGSQDGTVIGFSRDGARTIARVSGDGRIWAHALAGHTLLLAGDDAGVRAFDLASGREQPSSLGRDVHSLVTDGTHAIVGRGDEQPLVVVALATGNQLRTLEHSRGYTATQIVGDRVIAGRRHRAVGIWDLRTGRRYRAFGNGGSYALSPDGVHLATGAFRDGSRDVIDIYRVEDGTRVAELTAACSPGAMAFSPSSMQLAWACDDETRIVSLAGKDVARLRGIGAFVRTLAFSPDGSLFAVGGNDHVLHAWDTRTWQPLTRIRGSRGEIRQLSVAEPFLVTHAWGDHSAWLWVTDRVKPAIELGDRGRQIYAVATDGKAILVAVRERASGRMMIERWQGARREVARTAPPGSFGHDPLVRDIGFVAGGGAWLVGDGRIIVLDDALGHVWTSPAVTATTDFPITDGQAGASPDGAIAVLYAERTLVAYDLRERRELSRLAIGGCGFESPAVSPDGRRAAIVDTTGIAIVDVHAGRVVASLARPSRDQGERAIAWHSNSEVLAVIDGALLAWTPGATTALEASAPAVLSLAVAGDRVYLGRTDGIVVRRSLGHVRRTARSFAVTSATPCEPGEGGMLAGLGWLGTPRRGRLDDSGSYDDPDPIPELAPGDSED